MDTSTATVCNNARAKVLAWRLCFPPVGARVFTTFQTHSVSRSAPIKAAVEALVQASPRICGTPRAHHCRQMCRQMFVGDRRLQWSMIVSQTDIKSATLALVTGKLAEARSQLIACPPQVMLGANRRQIPLLVLARMMTKVSAATCCHLRLQLLLLQHLGSLATNLLALTFLVTQATLNMTLMIVVG